MKAERNAGALPACIWIVFSITKCHIMIKTADGITPHDFADADATQSI